VCSVCVGRETYLACGEVCEHAGECTAEPAALAIAMNTPQADDVPTARTGCTPRQTSSGTVMLPPPMPTTAETAPIPLPAAAIGPPVRTTAPPAAPPPGPPTAIRAATTKQYSAPHQRSTSPCTATANQLPSQPPSSRPGTIQATVGHSTLPRALCARAEDAPVRMMLASELASAVCITASAGIPCAGSSHTSAPI